MSINPEKMKASWLEAVVNGEAAGFARHFMPDIIDDLTALEAWVKEARGKLAEFKACMDAQRRGDDFHGDGNGDEESCADGVCFRIGPIIDRLLTPTPDGKEVKP